MSTMLTIAVIGFAIDAVLLVLVVWMFKSGWWKDSSRAWRKMTRPSRFWRR